MVADNKENKFWLESRQWKRKMAILDAALGIEATQANHDDFEYAWAYNKSKNKQYSQAYIAGLIGEKEGRKWLQENGYEVYEYEGTKAHFESIDYYTVQIRRTSLSMKRRRKQEYKEEDKRLIATRKQGIARQVRYLKEIFGERYFHARHLFIEISKLRESIRHGKKRRGSSQPDFITKKEKEFSFVEVKVNQSHLSVEQRGCFKLARKHGFNAMLLRVTVDGNVAKQITLLESKIKSDYKVKTAFRY